VSEDRFEGEPFEGDPLAGDAPEGERTARRWSPRRIVVLSLTPILALSLLLGFGLTRDPRALPSTLVGGPAPDFALRDLFSGEVVRLRDFRGQVVVVNFWASWCAPCRQEHPYLRAAWDRYRERGVVLVGIVFQDRESNARAYVDEMGGDWPFLVDPGSRTALDYGVFGIPETFFIGRDGVIAHKQVGASSYELLTDWIERLLRTPSGQIAGGG
jgi:cytochrome c biogenesis protein CcmG/thiol:disulfide interchange protein DsbE